MKVGYDAKRVFHNWRGLGNYSRDLITGLEKFFPGHDYILFSMDYTDQRALDFEEKNPRLKVVKPKTFFSRLFPSLWRSGYSKLFDEYELDIFHGLSHELPRKRNNSKTKFVVTIHDLIFIRYPEYFPAVDRKVYMAKVKYACKVADVIVAICEQTKNDLVEILEVPAAKIRVAYQSCNPIFFNKLSSDQIKNVLSKYSLNDEYFLFVGAFEERKNVLTLIDAYYHFGKSKKLVLVGKGKNYKKEMVKKITSLGLEDCVTILEGIPLEDLPAIYQGAFAFCFPSFFEGFGIPLIESLFSGKPVITTNGSCFPEVAGPGGLYCDPNNAFEITKAMELLSVDSVTYNKLSQEGLEHVSKFLPENTNKVMMDVYEELLSKG